MELNYDWNNINKNSRKLIVKAEHVFGLEEGKNPDLSGVWVSKPGLKGNGVRSKPLCIYGKNLYTGKEWVLVILSGVLYVKFCPKLAVLGSGYPLFTKLGEKKEKVKRMYVSMTRSGSMLIIILGATQGGWFKEIVWLLPHWVKGGQQTAKLNPSPICYGPTFFFFQFP